MSESYRNATEFDKKRGKRITRARERAGLTRKQLAAQIDVALSTLAGYETGGSDIGSEKLAKIATACNCSVDYLLGLTEYAQSSTDLAHDALYHSDSLSSRAFELGERYDRMGDAEKSICSAIVYLLSELSESSTAKDPGSLYFIDNNTGDGNPIALTSVESYFKACVESIKQNKEDKEKSDPEDDES